VSSSPWLHHTPAGNLEVSQTSPSLWGPTKDGWHPRLGQCWPQSSQVQSAYLAWLTLREVIYLMLSCTITSGEPSDSWHWQVHWENERVNFPTKTTREAAWREVIWARVPSSFQHQWVSSQLERDLTASFN
jgi:hypothetical protein